MRRFAPATWSAKIYTADEGYGTLESLVLAPNKLALNWKFFRATDNGIEDEFTITKTI